MRTRRGRRTAWPLAVAWAFAGALAVSLAQPSVAAAQSECSPYISGGPRQSGERRTEGLPSRVTISFGGETAVDGRILSVGINGIITETFNVGVYRYGWPLHRCTFRCDELRGVGFPVSGTHRGVNGSRSRPAQAEVSDCKPFPATEFRSVAGDRLTHPRAGPRGRHRSCGLRRCSGRRRRWTGLFQREHQPRLRDWIVRRPPRSTGRTRELRFHRRRTWPRPSGYFVADGLDPRIVLLDRSLDPVRIHGRGGGGARRIQVPPNRLVRAHDQDSGPRRGKRASRVPDAWRAISSPPSGLAVNANDIAVHPELGLLVAGDAFQDHYLSRPTSTEQRHTAFGSRSHPS